MSEIIEKIFVFTDISTHRIVAVKRSRGLNFCIFGAQWNCFEITAASPVALVSDSNLSWTPEKGIQTAPMLAAVDLERFRFLQRKLELLISMKANLHVMWLQMKPQLAHNRVIELPIQKRNMAKIMHLVELEKRHLKKKMNNFFAAFQLTVEQSADLADLEAKYRHMVNNFTLGGYSGVSRDLEEKHVKRSHS